MSNPHVVIDLVGTPFCEDSQRNRSIRNFECGAAYFIDSVYPLFFTEAILNQRLIMQSQCDVYETSLTKAIRIKHHHIRDDFASNTPETNAHTTKSNLVSSIL